MKKKLLMLILCLIMIITSLPTMAFTAVAAENTCDHKDATWSMSGTNKIMNCRCGDITFTPCSSIPTTSGNYYLTSDITQTAIAKITAANSVINFDLNGHTVTNTGSVTDDGMLSVSADRVTYSIYDSVGTGTYKNTSTADQIGIKFFYGSGSTFNMYGGTLEDWGTNMTSGGAVSIAQSGCVFNMYGGTVKNCDAWQGGAFFVASTATINVYGGSVTGCTAVKWNDSDGGGGAAIRAGANANVNIYGGEFTNNIATNSDMFRVSTGGTGKFSIMGGVFSDRPDESLIADGYSAVQSGNLWRVKEKNAWMQSGVSIRFSNPTGIRFVASVPKDNVVGGATYGMLIAPTEYVNTVSEFTKAVLDASSIQGVKYVDICSSDAGFKVNTAGEYYTFNGVLANILDTSMQFSAVAYVCTEEGEYIYSDYDSTQNSRNVAVVAGRALNDGIADYTPEQKATLKTLAQAETVSGKENMYLVWNEEFIGSTWDGTLWSTSSMPTSQSSDVSESADGNHIYIDENGNLVLKVVRENDSEKPFSVPYHMSTANSMNWQYGYLEVKAKVPMGAGVFPSLFTLQKDEYKTDGYHAEIDIFECMSSSTGVAANAHIWYNSGTCVATMNGKEFHNHITITSDEFHTFGFYWDETTIKIYIDGKLYRSANLDEASWGSVQGQTKPSNTAEIVNSPMYLLIGNPIYTEGSPNHWWTTGDDRYIKNPEEYEVGDAVSEYVVEYVRLYQNEDGILHTN